MSGFQDSLIYFTIGVPAEISNILPNIASVNPDVKLVYLDDIVSSVYPARYFSEEEAAQEAAHEDEHELEDEEMTHEEENTLDIEAVDDGQTSEEKDPDQLEWESVIDEEHDHDHEGRDPHIWMSPKRVIVMVEAIKGSLSELDPSNKEIYEANAAAFIEEMKKIDEEFIDLSEQLSQKTFIMMHPSLGYLADDYGFTMVALEEDGKEATASHLQEIIDFAKAEDIHVIFYQTEFDSSQAKTLASEIKGEVLALDILSFDYLENMNNVLDVFGQVLE
jgi:zinc transport system substrate-binding protein